MDREAAILLPGAILPAGPAYDGLIAALGTTREVHAKDLEVYADDAPPPDFGLETEVAGVLRWADEAGFERAPPRRLLRRGSRGHRARGPASRPRANPGAHGAGLGGQRGDERRGEVGTRNASRRPWRSKTLTR